MQWGKEVLMETNITINKKILDEIKISVKKLAEYIAYESIRLIESGGIDPENPMTANIIFQTSLCNAKNYFKNKKLSKEVNNLLKF